MKFKDLVKKEEKDLQQTLQELREKYQDMKFKVANNQLKNIREIRVVKKNMARILFLLNAKKTSPVKNIVKTNKIESK